MPDTATTLPADPAVVYRFTLAVRYYAGRIERRGFCFTQDLLEDGFDMPFLLAHWTAIRERGEDLADARRRTGG